MSTLPSGSEWSMASIELYHQAIAEAAAHYGLDTYPNQLEIITAEQMMDAYASTGMPLSYHHWSFGKQFVLTEQQYRRGHMGLAYEIVINSNPCIAYLMEENSLSMMALVIAHASYGHNSFFKGNYLFRSWTDASAIIDYLVFAKDYLRDCEQRYGESVVEEWLDACHALMNLGVDRYKRPAKSAWHDDAAQQREREAYQQSQVNELWRTFPRHAEAAAQAQPKRFPEEPQENLLYFIEKYAPLLEPWQREVVRIVRKMAQYFYPQRQTQVMNEGWASYWHYTLLNRLYDTGLVDDSLMFEFLHSHTSVIRQLPVQSKYYSGINPYALGFAMWRDLRRICETPTAEDERWFPQLAGQNWLQSFDFAMRNFKDESFIAQYLSPKIMRDFRLFALHDDDQLDHLHINAIHDEAGYQDLRRIMSNQYNLSQREPNIQVYDVNTRGDRSLTLRHQLEQRRPLGPDSARVLQYVAKLWGFKVRLETVNHEGRTLQTLEYQHEKRH